MSMKCRREPCSSCPYRQDVPGGVWDAEEYEKLAGFSAPFPALAYFLCHQGGTEHPQLCRGWLKVERDSVAVRLLLHTGQLTPAERDRPVTVALYPTGAE